MNQTSDSKFLAKNPMPHISNVPLTTPHFDYKLFLSIRSKKALALNGAQCVFTRHRINVYVFGGNADEDIYPGHRVIYRGILSRCYDINSWKKMEVHDLSAAFS